LQRSGTIAQSVQDHERIVAALSTGDAQKAEQALAAHLDHIHRTTQAVMTPSSEVKAKGAAR
jgi:DNA-binding FadR family transcriptional regulator